MLVKNSSQCPATENVTHKVVARPEKRQLPVTRELEVVANIVIGACSIQQLVGGIGLLEPNLVRSGINGMAERVYSGERETMREAAGGFKDSGIETGVHIRQRNKDSSEAIIPNNDRSWAEWIRRAAGNSVYAGALDAILVAACFSWSNRITRIKVLTRSEAVQVDSAGQLSASASLVTNRNLQVMDGFQLRL